MWWGVSQTNQTNTWLKCGPQGPHRPLSPPQAQSESQQKDPPRSQLGPPRPPQAQSAPVGSQQEGPPRPHQGPPRPPASRQSGGPTVRRSSSPGSSLPTTLEGCTGCPGSSPGHYPRSWPRLRTGLGHPEPWQPSDPLGRPQDCPFPPQGLQDLLAGTQASPLARQGQPLPSTLPLTSSTVASRLGPGRPCPTS